MITTDEIINFLKDLSAADKIYPDSDLFEDIGIIGDDFKEMIDKFAGKYSVDMKNYLWYFHNVDEGSGNFGGLFFKAPYNRVERIPITPLLLTDIANKRKWDIDYPAHKIPKKRYDLLINSILIGLFLIFVVVISIKKCAT